MCNSKKQLRVSTGIPDPVLVEKDRVGTSGEAGAGAPKVCGGERLTKYAGPDGTDGRTIDVMGHVASRPFPGHGSTQRDKEVGTPHPAYGRIANR